MEQSQVLLKAKITVKTASSTLGSNILFEMLNEHNTKLSDGSTIIDQTYARTTSKVIIKYGDKLKKIIPKGSELHIGMTHSPGTYNIEILGNIPEFTRRSSGVYAIGILNNLSSGDVIHELFINPRIFRTTVVKTKIRLRLPSNVKIEKFYPLDNISNVELISDGYLIDAGHGAFIGTIPRWMESQLPRLTLFDGTVQYYASATSDVRAIKPKDSSVDDPKTNAIIKFDDTFATNMIGPKLYGKRLVSNYDDVHDIITHTYTTFPNKKLKEIIIAGTGTYIRFDETTHTLSYDDYVYDDAGKIAENYICAALKFVFTDGTFDTDYFIQEYGRESCLLEGTPIMTYTGKKAVQDIQYDDLVLSYDFFRGKLCYQLPSFIDREQSPDVYAEIIFEDDSFVRISGSHDFYNIKNGTHQKLFAKDLNTLDKSQWQFMQLQENLSYKPIAIKDINVVNASANAYSLYTSGLQTYFANNILCSSQDFNLFGKTVNNKLDTQRLEYVKNNEQYTKDDFIKEFGDISSTVYYGQLQHILYNGFKLGLSKDYESLIDKQYGSYAYSAKYGIDMLWSKPKDLPNIDGEEACYIVLMEKDVMLFKNLYKVGTIVDLPYNEKGWYCVADTNIYYDKYEIKTNTVLEKVV